jgi:hypothetical protein
MAVLKSLKRREQLPADRILLLWLQHTLEAEFYSRHFRRVIVSYEQFLKNPSAIVGSVQGLWPGLDFAAKEQEDGVKVEVRPDLNQPKTPLIAQPIGSMGSCCSSPSMSTKPSALAIYQISSNWIAPGKHCTIICIALCSN